MSCEHTRLLVLSLGQALGRVICKDCSHDYLIHHPGDSLFRTEQVLGGMMKAAEKQAQEDHYEELVRRAGR